MSRSHNTARCPSCKRQIGVHHTFLVGWVLNTHMIGSYMDHSISNEYEIETGRALFNRAAKADNEITCPGSGEYVEESQIQGES